MTTTTELAIYDATSAKNLAYFSANHAANGALHAIDMFARFVNDGMDHDMFAAVVAEAAAYNTEFAAQFMQTIQMLSAHVRIVAAPAE